MKRNFTLFCLLLSFTWSYAQTTIWGGPNDPNSTFTGGLNDWTTVGLYSENPDSAANAVWTFTRLGDGRTGAYWGTLGAIQSPSGSTGAMIFNSDYLDNRGIAGNFGNGPAPSPHSGALISPTINCSSFGSVAISFYQFYRNFDSKCYVEVSTDGGVNWIGRQDINPDIASGATTPRNSRKLLDFSVELAGEANAKIRFVFEGDYYFWIVDDVTLVTLPANDLAIISNFYTPGAYMQPKSQICNDTFVFSANLGNLGGQDQHNVEFVGQILDIDRTTVLFEDILVIPTLAVNENDTNYVTPNRFIPNNLNPGKYYIRWTVRVPGSPDFTPGNNTKLDSFEVSTNKYSREPRSTGGVRAGSGAAYTQGCLYRTSNCWNQNDKFFAESAEYSVVANQQGTLNGYQNQIYLLRTNDDILEDWSNFDATMGINSPSVTLKSAEQFTFSTERNYDLVNVPLTDFNTGDKVALEPNSRYFLLCEHPQETDPNTGTYRFHAISTEKNYQNQAFGVTVIDNAGAWFNGWQSGQVPVMRMYIEVILKTDDKELPGQVLSISPNPVVSDKLNVAMNFDNATDANLYIFDINGKVKTFDNYKGITKENVVLNVSSLNSGQYFIRVSNNEGTKTLKFTVVK
ncbi:MAG: T9SS type A sorting domain-containing protein [Bacteroidota bacterium]|nr:T9SS type A sorting domain-containing protein [Bacteroidota bacterium]